MRLVKMGCAFLLFFCCCGLLRAEDDKTLAELRRKAEIQKNDSGYTAVCRYLVEIEEHPELLFAYADSVKQQGIRNRSLDNFFDYYSFCGEAYFISGEIEKGFTWKRKGFFLAKKSGRVDRLVETSSDMGYYFNVDARYDSARHYLKMGLEASEQLPGLSESYRVMLTNYASSFLYEGKTDSALVYTLRAEQRSREDKDTVMLIENLNQLGTLYRRQKQLDNSISSFEKAVHLSELQGNVKTLAYIYANIATAYSDWNRPLDGIPFSRKALDIALKDGNPRMIGICYTNLGAILCNCDDKIPEGIEVLKKAIPLLEELNDRRRLCEVYRYLVNACRQEGHIDMAMDYLKKLDKIANEQKTDVELYRYYQAKASLLYDYGKYSEAADCFRRLIQMNDSGVLDSRDYDYYYHLGRSLHALHDNASAYEALEKAYTLRESSFKEESTTQLSDYSVKYQTKEKELEIVRLRQVELERTAQLMRNRIGFGVILAVFIIALLLLLYTRQRQKVRLAQLAQAAGEKEREFLSLQKETEQRLTRKYLEGLESERERMATELHDDVCNSLLALDMKIRLILGDDRKMDEQLTLLDDTRERLRTLSHELMPPVFQYATIDEMLTDYMLHLALPDSTKARYSSTEGMDWSSIPQNIGFEYYRIVQEAVGNAMKYADASLIRVELFCEGDQLSLLIADDGKGFDPNRKRKGIGLQTILQRAEMIGAQVDLTTDIGKGVHLQVSTILK